VSYLLFLIGVGLGVILFVVTFFIAAAQPDVAVADAVAPILPTVPGLSPAPTDTLAP
jgi:hypothetical protein